jgi:hypothetical protein
MPPFLDHIGVIIRVCAEPEVLRVYTRGVIARVANAKPLRDVPLKDEIGEAVDRVGFPVKREEDVTT